MVGGWAVVFRWSVAAKFDAKWDVGRFFGLSGLRFLSPKGEWFAGRSSMGCWS
jgi:hypothetical protein